MKNHPDPKFEPLISVVAPVYNEEKNLHAFYARILAALKGFRYEFIFINDGSQDGSWEILERFCATDSHVRALDFSRNFGHQAAICAGLDSATGDAVVIIDSDLQDPPEVIPLMIAKWQEGHDVVYGVRTERKGESTFKKWTAALFYRVFRHSTEMDAPMNAGDFRLLSRDVVEALKETPERVRFLRGLIRWVGYRQIGIPYSRDERLAGKSNYPLVRMFRLAFDGITSFSLLPLQLASYLGLTVTLVAFLVAAYSLYIKLFTDTAVKGWASLFVIVAFLGGIQLLMIGIVGEYVGRIYQEVKRRPLYLLRKKLGAGDR